MPVVDRPALIEDIVYWLPESSTLSKPSLTKLAGLVIDRIGDDSDNTPQILCECLHAAAIKNATEGVASREVKKETLGGHTKEYFEGGDKAFWNEFIDRLDYICPMFGYDKPVSLGISIAPGKPMNICGEDLEPIY